VPRSWRRWPGARVLLMDKGVGIAITPPVVVMAPVVVAPSVVVQDNYVYYPGYGIYYNSVRRQYAYLQGGVWIWAPAPGGVSVEVLLASPSVNMNFHDSLANHHAATLRMYPRNWKPSGAHQEKKNDLKAGPPNDNKKMRGQPDAGISANTIPTQAFATRSGSSIANTNAAMPANGALAPPTNLRVVSK
jgi:hypothetical protein